MTHSYQPTVQIKITRMAGGSMQNLTSRPKSHWKSKPGAEPPSTQRGRKSGDAQSPSVRPKPRHCCHHERPPLCPLSVRVSRARAACVRPPRRLRSPRCCSRPMPADPAGGTAWTSPPGSSPRWSFCSISPTSPSCPRPLPAPLKAGWAATIRASGISSSITTPISFSRMRRGLVLIGSWLRCVLGVLLAFSAVFSLLICQIETNSIVFHMWSVFKSEVFKKIRSESFRREKLSSPIWNTFARLSVRIQKCIHE